MPGFGGGGGAVKPPGGWLKGDLETPVQESLGKADAAIPSSEKGAASGVASLDTTGVVPAAQVLSAAVFPLGCYENPITDYLAARPANLPFPVAHWVVTASPANAVEGDLITIIASPTVTYRYRQHWDDTNGTGIANWRAKSNANTPTRSTTRDVGGGATAGSLEWTAVAAGNTSVEYGGTVSVPASTPLTYKVWIYNGDTVSRGCRIGYDQFNGGTYLSSGSSTTTQVAAGTWGEFTIEFTSSSTTTAIRLSGLVESAPTGVAFNLDDARVI